ncbi:MAG: DUF1385 domain-containing protein [Lachnospiraceae bacterium]|nr:DUF1385 domain-containing protein [Lachnospiraceae bacterium]
MSKKKQHSVYSGIGGQAVLEGIMMKNKNEYSVAVRLPNGGISVERFEDKGVISLNSVWRKVPLVRGVINFIESLSLGMKSLTYYSSFFEEEERRTNQDVALEKKHGSKAESVVTGITIFVSLILAIALFMVAPYFLSNWVGKYIENTTVILILEGVIRLTIFILYVVLISLMKDIKRVYMYHGSEHKCINCIENGLPLTVENVKKSSRFHRRCGTSFLLLVMIVSIILFFFIRVESPMLRIGLRILLIPVIAGFSYELLRLAGRYDNVFVKIISAPGLLMQHITTKEPEEDMIEVAIAAIEEVFNWKKFENKHFNQKVVKKKAKNAAGEMVDTDEETVQVDVKELNEKLSDDEDYRVLGNHIEKKEEP